MIPVPVEAVKNINTAAAEINNQISIRSAAVRINKDGNGNGKQSAGCGYAV